MYIDIVTSIKMQMVSKGVKTQQELSDLSGISVQVISRIFSTNDGKLSTVIELVESLGGEIKLDFAFY